MRAGRGTLRAGPRYAAAGPSCGKPHFQKMLQHEISLYNFTMVRHN